MGVLLVQGGGARRMGVSGRGLGCNVGTAEDSSCWSRVFFSSRRRHTRWPRDWSSDVCSSDLRDVVVNINSPGGDFFEGVAIYNMLREHPHKVTVQVMGLAASAASVIAMAGDEILVGDGSFLMIHNTWVLAIGNRHDMAEAAELLEQFDMAMADVYSDRTGQDKNDIIRMMDKETWINASKAVEEGFATGYLDSNLIADDVSAEADVKYLAVVETAMAKAGHTRSERREILKGLFSSKPGAAEDDAMPRASDSSELVELVDLIRGLS